MSFDAERIDLANAFASGAISEADYAARLFAVDRRAQLYLFAERKAARPPKKMDRAPADPSPHYAQASGQLIDEVRMSPTAMRLVLKLKALARGRGTVTAYVGQLADMLQVSHRTLQRAQRRAEACGFLRITPVREGRINSPNVYGFQEGAFPQGRTERYGTPRRRRVLRGGDKNAAPRATAFGSTPLPPTGGIVERRAASRGATHVSSPLNALRPQDASRGGAQIPCQPIDRDPFQIDLEEAIARAKATGPP